MSETALKIKTYPDPALRKKAMPVKKIDAVHRDILSQMAQAMYAAKGIGLAAPQIGIAQEMLVADIGSGLYKLINPKVVKRQGTQALEEGCLSVPGICVRVKRAKKAVVNALDEEDRPVRIEAEGLLACVLQHEIDHLKGKLIIDYASIFKRIEIRKKLSTKTCQQI